VLRDLKLPGGDPFAVAAVVFGLASTYLLVSRVLRAFILWHTRYLLTDQRIVVVSGRSGRRRTSADLSSLVGVGRVSA
jgi:hypothetical protein